MSGIRSWFIFLIWLIVPLLAVACAGGETQEGTRELPTLMQLPTQPPTDIPTATDTPTRTPTNTATAIPTDTLIPTATSTDTPVPTATRTRVPATATLTATLRPTFTATVAAPQIISFTASAASGAPGDQITLFWESQADTARIDEIHEGTVLQNFSVVPNGQLPVSLPDVRGQVTYRLIVVRGGQQVTRDVQVEVRSVCQPSWFFGDENALPDSGCPSAPAATVTGKVQQFERGLMFSLTISGENRVYGLNTQDNRYMVYRNNWDGTTTYTDPCGTAPAGLMDPQDVFNWAYHTTLGTVGLWCNPNGGIGWATAPANLSSQQTYQFESQRTGFYIRIAGVGTFWLSGTPDTGTWQRLNIP